MKDRIIYIVGNPDPEAKFLESIHHLGYKAGVLLDSQLPVKKLDKYDRIERIDFQKIDDELIRLDRLNLSITGVVCTYENYVIAKAKIGQYFNLNTISVTSAQISTDKLLMRQAFLEKDPTMTPNFRLINSIDEALLFANKYKYPVMIKPTNLVKSLLVIKCSNEEALINNFKYAQESIKELYQKYNIYDRTPQIIIEEFITGKSCSIAAFVDAYGVPHFCDSITQLTSAQEIGVNDNYLYARHLPADFSEEMTSKLFDVAKKGIEALGMRSSPAHVELMYDGLNIKLIEIGARIGGYRPRMYDYSYGIDLIEQEVKLAIGEKPQLAGDFKSYCAVYELFPDHEGIFIGVNNSNNTEVYKYYSVKAKPGQLVGPAKNGYKAAAIIIVCSQDKQLFTTICNSVSQLSVKLEK